MQWLVPQGAALELTEARDSHARLPKAQIAVAGAEVVQFAGTPATKISTLKGSVVNCSGTARWVLGARHTTLAFEKAVYDATIAFSNDGESCVQSRATPYWTNNTM